MTIDKGRGWANHPERSKQPIEYYRDAENINPALYGTQGLVIGSLPALDENGRFYENPSHSHYIVDAGSQLLFIFKGSLGYIGKIE